MREGPLADLFRSTADDAPVDPPELDAPRYGREDPAEAKKAAEEAHPREEALAPEPVVEETPAREPAPVSDTFYDQESEPESLTSDTAPGAPERLKKVFAEEPRPRLEREDYLP
ncbi:MAG: hypothetical protein JST31_17475, partial [Actinobacteria bacterium]|nr:hypothetical protein [Actinomycetota bacterium]